MLPTAAFANSAQHEERALQTKAHLIPAPCDSFRPIALVREARRHVTVPRDMVGEVPKGRIMKEAEWRKLGIIQSCGWEHYAIHK